VLESDAIKELERVQVKYNYIAALKRTWEEFEKANRKHEEERAAEQAVAMAS
jgi:hypothetical protein